jgi:hypothetical protein
MLFFLLFKLEISKILFIFFLLKPNGVDRYIKYLILVSRIFLNLIIISIRLTAKHHLLKSYILSFFFKFSTVHFLKHIYQRHQKLYLIQLKKTML